MPSLPPLRRKPATPPWRAGVCLILAVLFLYNPFLVILGASDGLHVRHPLSFRATVANSELAHYTTDSAKPLLLASALPAREPVQPARRYGAEAIHTGDFGRGAPQALCNSLYVRPPPLSSSTL